TPWRATQEESTMSVMTAHPLNARSGEIDGRDGSGRAAQGPGRRAGRRRGPGRLDPSPRRRWPDEFAEAVGPLTAGLHRLARRSVGSEAVADDGVQEALISFWREGTLPPNPNGWLARAVVHRSLHLNRCRRRRRLHEERACAHRLEFAPAEDASRGLEAEE